MRPKIFVRVLRSFDTETQFEQVPEALKGVACAGSPTLKARVVWSDEDIDEGIFDDGPDLSDLEN
jgi:hypothetical protein